MYGKFLLQVISWSVAVVERNQILGIGRLLSRFWLPLPVIQPQLVQCTDFPMLVLLFFHVMEEFLVAILENLYLPGIIFC